MSGSVVDLAAARDCMLELDATVIIFCFGGGEGGVRWGWETICYDSLFCGVGVLTVQM